MKKNIIQCRCCNNNLHPFISFGKMPIANGFLLRKNFKNEFFFDLRVCFCKNCYLFQLFKQPSPKKMFHKNYAFFSETSEYMKRHFKKTASLITRNFRKRKNFSILELGSNDGIFLKNFKNNDHLGIEPSYNVFKVAKSRGINCINKFFSTSLALKLSKKFDVIYSANVLCHISNIKDAIQGVSILLKKNGVFIFEDPYLGEMIKKTSYDQIYDEHVFIFSVHSVISICNRYNLELYDAEHQITHGGSMRYFICNKGEFKGTVRLKNILNQEKRNGLDRISTFKKFKNQCGNSKKRLLELLLSLKKKNKIIAGFGATSKSTTVLNYCGLTDKTISYITDSTPIKQNKFSPGSHIPIKTYKYFVKNLPDYALLFAWNHKEEILKKNNFFEKLGGRWILYVPKIKVL
jgi:methylation protein EvaC